MVAVRNRHVTHTCVQTWQCSRIDVLRRHDFFRKQLLLYIYTLYICPALQ